jgi:16S rRNA (uracil1498-N3)-methyltransferase
MSRFFVSGSNLFGGIAWLSNKDEKRISRFIARGGGPFVLCDSRGRDINFQKSSNREYFAQYSDNSATPGEPHVRCTVYLAFSEEKRVRSVIRKCTELGAHRFVVFPSSRCTSVPSSFALLSRARKWQSIAYNAAVDSERGIIPNVYTASSFQQAVSLASAADLPLFLYEEETNLKIGDAINSAATFTSISIMTGPEFGFSPKEASLAIGAGMKSVSLGKRIIGCDTAPIYALSAIMLLTGNI